MTVSHRVVDDTTIPGRSAFAFGDHPAVAELRTLVEDAAQRLEGKGWDNLAHVAAFSRALAFSKETVLERCVDAMDRRHLALLLFRLLPEHARARPFAPLPAHVVERARDGFVLTPADLPALRDGLCAHLADPELLTRAIVPGSTWLQPRGVCPAAATGNVVLVRVDSVAHGIARCSAISSAVGSSVVSSSVVSSSAVGDRAYDVRTDVEGRPILLEGKVQPIEIPLDSLTSWLLGAGSDARGLDLRSLDDRCVLLLYAHMLRERGLFDALAHADAFDQALVEGCAHAALDAVGSFIVDPIASRIVLRSHAGDLGWPDRAWEMLATTSCVRDLPLRTAAPDSSLGFARDVVWVDALLEPGLVAGRLSSTFAGRAFARVCTSLLAPLGVLPCSGMKDGSGDVLLQMLAPNGTVTRLVATFHEQPRLMPLQDAWRAGHGRAVPDPRNGPQHDLAAMPAWVAFFYEALAPDPMDEALA